jgi:hypothetical protein
MGHQRWKDNHRTFIKPRLSGKIMVEPNNWTIFYRFLASEIPLNLPLVSVTPACFSARDPGPILGLRGEIPYTSLCMPSMAFSFGGIPTSVLKLKIQKKEKMLLA